MELFTASQFDRVADLARSQWGIELPPSKRALLESRLAKFVRRSSYPDAKTFINAVLNGDDLQSFFDLISTNFTSFFREQPAFDFLERAFYTPLARGNVTRPGRRLRFWSAACSTGPEPYSLAIQARELLPGLDQWDFRILATDLDTNAIDTARRAVYTTDMVAGVPDALRKKWFRSVTVDDKPMFQVHPDVRRLVAPRQLNLMESWPMKGPFDVIFCRNVMIYFARETRERLVNRFAKLLRPDGVLVIGSSETLAGLNTPFHTVQPSVYIRTEGASA